MPANKQNDIGIGAPSIRRTVSSSKLFAKMRDSRDQAVVNAGNGNHEAAYKALKEYRSYSSLAEVTGLNAMLQTTASALREYDPVSAVQAASLMPAGVDRAFLNVGASTKMYDDDTNAEYWEARGGSQAASRKLSDYKRGAYRDDPARSAEAAQLLDMVRTASEGKGELDVRAAEQVFEDTRVGFDTYGSTVNAPVVSNTGNEVVAMDDAKVRSMTPALASFRRAANMPVSSVKSLFTQVRDAYVATSSDGPANYSDLNGYQAQAANEYAAQTMGKLAKGISSPESAALVNTALNSREHGLMLKPSIMASPGNLVSALNTVGTRTKQAMKIVDARIASGALSEAQGELMKAQIVYQKAPSYFEPNADLKASFATNAKKAFEFGMAESETKLALSASVAGHPKAEAYSVSAIGALGATQQGVDALVSAGESAGLSQDQLTVLEASVGDLSAASGPGVARTGSLWQGGVNDLNSMATYKQELEGIIPHLESAWKQAGDVTAKSARKAELDYAKSTLKALGLAGDKIVAQADVVDPKEDLATAVDNIIAAKGYGVDSAKADQVRAQSTKQYDKALDAFLAKGVGSSRLAPSFAVDLSRTLKKDARFPTAEGSTTAALEDFLPASVLNKTYATPTEARAALKTAIIDSGMARVSVTGEGAVTFAIAAGAARNASLIRTTPDFTRTPEQMRTDLENIVPVGSPFRDRVLRSIDVDVNKYNGTVKARAAYGDIRAAGVDLTDPRLLKSINSQIAPAAGESKADDALSLAMLDPAMAKMYMASRMEAQRQANAIELASKKAGFSAAAAAQAHVREKELRQDERAFDREQSVLEARHKGYTSILRAPDEEGDLLALKRQAASKYIGAAAAPSAPSAE